MSKTKEPTTIVLTYGSLQRLRQLVREMEVTVSADLLRAGKLEGEITTILRKQLMPPPPAGDHVTPAQARDYDEEVYTWMQHTAAVTIDAPTRDTVRDVLRAATTAKKLRGSISDALLLEAFGVV